MINISEVLETNKIDWSFLGEGEWTVTSFADALGAKKEWVISTENGVKAADMPAEVEMRERGGFTLDNAGRKLRLRPLMLVENESYGVYATLSDIHFQ